MSADNWTTCPRCFSEAVTAAQAAHDELPRLYGQIPLDEFDARRAALPAVPDRESFEPTFREDYEFYDAELGEVRASYKGHCTICRLSVELEASRKFWPDAS